MPETSEKTENPREVIARIIKSCVYGQLATISADGKRPCVRPVCAFLQDDFSILVPSHSRTRKIEEIENNPAVELCFVDDEHWQVRLSGKAEVVESIEVKQRLIDTTLSPKLWKGFFSEGAADEKFVLYRVRPESAEWMKEWELRYRSVELG